MSGLLVVGGRGRGREGRSRFVFARASGFRIGLGLRAEGFRVVGSAFLDIAGASGVGEGSTHIFDTPGAGCFDFVGAPGVGVGGDGWLAGWSSGWMAE